MATTRLTRTQTAGTRTKATLSTWVKRGDLSEDTLYTQFADGTNFTRFRFTSDTINANDRTSGVENWYFTTNAVYRDPTAWYHVVISIDTTQSTDTDRLRCWVNGVLQTFTSQSYPTEDANMNMNQTGQTSQIGANELTADYFDGVMAHTHWTDGYSYAASDFGETDSTSGIWIAKSGPSVTYGTNGFFLKYQDTAAFGDDSSGETNDFTLSGTMTQTKDSPDNNFCTINPLAFAADGFTIVNANTAISAVTDTASYTAYGTMAVNTGKWYWEAKAVNVDSTSYRHSHGIGDVEYAVQAYAGEAGDQTNAWTYGNNGGYKTGGSGGQESGDYLSYETGDFLMFALDCDNSKLYLGKNGTWQKSGVPTSGATGTGAISIVADRTYAPAFVMRYAANQVAANFGNGYFGTTSHGETNADDAGIGLFKYDVPAGYYALCTNNFGDQS